MLLTHTSGLSYGFDADGTYNQLDKLYRDRGLRQDRFNGNLSDFCSVLVELPLLFQPGEHWSYGYNTDVVGRLVEVQVFRVRVGRLVELRV